MTKEKNNVQEEQSEFAWEREIDSNLKERKNEFYWNENIKVEEPQKQDEEEVLNNSDDGETNTEFTNGNVNIGLTPEQKGWYITEIIFATILLSYLGIAIESVPVTAIIIGVYILFLIYRIQKKKAKNRTQFLLQQLEEEGYSLNERYDGQGVSVFIDRNKKEMLVAFTGGAKIAKLPLCLIVKAEYDEQTSSEVLAPEGVRSAIAIRGERVEEYREKTGSRKIQNYYNRIVVYITYTNLKTGVLERSNIDFINRRLFDSAVYTFGYKDAALSLVDNLNAIANNHNYSLETYFGEILNSLSKEEELSINKNLKKALEESLKMDIQPIYLMSVHEAKKLINSVIELLDKEEKILSDETLTKLLKEVRERYNTVLSYVEMNSKLNDNKKKFTENEIEKYSKLSIEDKPKYRMITKEAGQQIIESFNQTLKAIIDNYGEQSEECKKCSKLIKEMNELVKQRINDPNNTKLHLLHYNKSIEFDRLMDEFKEM